jgi:hypothetical protein
VKGPSPSSDSHGPVAVHLPPSLLPPIESAATTKPSPAWRHHARCRSSSKTPLRRSSSVSAAADAAPTADVIDGSPEEEEDAGAPTTSDAGPRPKRQAQPNKQYAGPEWDV